MLLIVLKPFADRSNLSTDCERVSVDNVNFPAGFRHLLRNREWNPDAKNC